MSETASTCDHCGAVLVATDMHNLQRIEEEVIDHASTLQAERPSSRGRTPWFPTGRRDPAVLVRTPRYAYAARSYWVCADCLHKAEADERGLFAFHRRATLTVALAAGGLGAIMLFVWVVWPGVYAGLGPTNPAQPYAGAPPPTTRPYRPPFSATTPAAP